MSERCWHWQGLLGLTQLDIYEMAHSNNDAAQLLSELNTLHSREVAAPLCHHYALWKTLRTSLPLAFSMRAYRDCSQVHPTIAQKRS